MSLLAGVDQKILEYETTNGKGGGRDEASFELRHISASSSDDDMTARLYSRQRCPPDLSKRYIHKYSISVAILTLLLYLIPPSNVCVSKPPSSCWILVFSAVQLTFLQQTFFLLLYHIKRILPRTLLKVVVSCALYSSWADAPIHV